MVPTVTKPKTAATKITSPAFAWEAGYISIGISGSHGPNRKIVNNTQGVIPPAVSPRSLGTAAFVPGMFTFETVAAGPLEASTPEATRLATTGASPDGNGTDAWA